MTEANRNALAILGLSLIWPIALAAQLTLDLSRGTRDLPHILMSNWAVYAPLCMMHGLVFFNLSILVRLWRPRSSATEKVAMGTEQSRYFGRILYKIGRPGFGRYWPWWAGAGHLRVDHDRIEASVGTTPINPFPIRSHEIVRFSDVFSRIDIVLESGANIVLWTLEPRRVAAAIQSTRIK